MKTDLPEGAIFKFRQHGRWTYGKVLLKGRLWQREYIEDIPEGTLIHRCKWQGNETLIVLDEEVTKAPQYRLRRFVKHRLVGSQIFSDPAKADKEGQEWAREAGENTYSVTVAKRVRV